MTSAERWRATGTDIARRLESWSEVLAATHLAFDVRHTPRTAGQFQGAVARRAFGDLMLVDCAASPFLGHRGRVVMGAQRDEQQDENILGFQFVRSGVELVREGHRQLALNPGDIVLWDGLQPTDIEIVKPFCKRTLIFPRDRALSGGEQQMVVLAQALVSQPRYILIDELSLGLAPVVVNRLIPTIRAVAESGIGVLLIEQFVTVALGLANRAHIMEGGRLQFSGYAQELRENTDLLHTAYLLRGAKTNGAGAITAPEPEPR